MVVMDIRLKVTMHRLRRYRKGQKLMKQAVRRAVKRSRTPYTAAVAEVSKHKKSTVRKATRIRNFSLVSKGHPVNLYEMARRPRKTSAGVSGRIGDRAVKVPRAFIHNRKVLVRQSQSQNPRRPGALTKHSEALRAVTGPSVPTAASKVQSRVIRKAFRALLRKEMQSALNRAR